ncbi:MAG: Hsp20/alpha crystallin family protein [Eisenbergiella sp.]|nr:Hsp20/alpha crystallin family protein [Bacillota bacterium]
MLLPRLWDEDIFEDMDNLMRWPDESAFFGKNNPLYGKHGKNLMKTDVKEKNDSYEVDIDLPGFKKDEVSVSLENGYLNISAAKGLDKDETNQETGKYIRRERYAGSLSRTFYVGEEVELEDVSARFEDGILHLNILKKEEKKVEKKDTRIAIEG